MKLGVTVSPPDTALSSVTVNVIESPSSARSHRRWSPPVRRRPRSSPVAVSVAVNRPPSSPRPSAPTVNVSSASESVSSVVETVKLCVSPAVPAKVSPRGVLGVVGALRGRHVREGGRHRQPAPTPPCPSVTVKLIESALLGRSIFDGYRWCFVVHDRPRGRVRRRHRLPSFPRPSDRP